MPAGKRTQPMGKQNPPSEDPPRGPTFTADIVNRPLSEADAAGICDTPALCFEHSDWVRCGPCSLQRAARELWGEFAGS
jgi:hypothetical protein